MKNILFFLLALISANLFSQNIQLDWVKTFQAYAGAEVFNKCIDVNTDGDTYVAGYYTATVDFDPDDNNELMYTNNGGGGLFINKLDDNGNLLWVKEYSGQNGSGASDIKVVYENGQEYIYVLGFFSGILDIDNDANTVNFSTEQNNRDIDIFLLKLDSAGHFIWAKHIGDDSADVSYEIAVDSTNNVYITGFFNTNLYTFILAEPYLSVTDQAHDMRIIKIAPSGTTVWEKTLSGNGYVGANSITVDNNNDIIIAGNYTGTIDFDPSSNVFQMTSYDNYDDIFILKLNNNGNFIWAKQLIGNNSDALIDIKIDNNNNNIYLVGESSSNIEFEAGHNIYDSSLANTYLVKYNSSGNFIWVTQFVNISFFKTLNIHNNKIFLSGLAYQNTNYEYINAQGRFPIPHQLDTFKNIVLSINENGTPIDYFYVSPQLSGDLSIYDIKSQNDNLFICGRMGCSSDDSIDFAPGGSTYFVPTLMGGPDGFIAKYNFITSDIKSNNLEFISIYPNPSINGVFYVSNEQLATLDITVFDTTGKIVLKQVSNNPSTQINLSKQTKGIYFVKIDNKNMVVTKKILIE